MLVGPTSDRWMCARGAGSAADVLANVALNELETVQQAGRTVIGDAYLDRVDPRHDVDAGAAARAEAITNRNVLERCTGKLVKRIHDHSPAQAYSLTVV